MKPTEHVEYLLRQGRKPKELLALGFPKRVITKVRRQLEEEKIAQQVKMTKAGHKAKGCPQPSVVSEGNMETMYKKLASLESELSELKGRIELLESARAESASVEDIEARLDDTPAIGLKHRFKCDCGASGLVALHIKCTKCGKETWWGWFPK